MVKVAVETDWPSELERWFGPFLERLENKFQRTMAPLYLLGLITPGRRKSIEPMAQRVASGKWQKLHHFVCVSRWECSALGDVLLSQANALVGGSDAHLIVDDTAIRKKGRHSVGVARQWCGETGKIDNCQTLVSLTLSRGEVPICVGLRLFLTEEWAADEERRRKCKVPSDVRYQPKWQIALEEIDRVRAAGARFKDLLADAAYGTSSEFRHGLSERELVWAVGVESNLKVYPIDVRVSNLSYQGRGRPVKHPTVSCEGLKAREMIESLGAKIFRMITWRQGTKGPLRARFAAVRVRVADGAKISRGKRLPGQRAWLICEWRTSGEKKYYLSSLPQTATRTQLARQIKARWVCEQPHQQMKQELGLDHFEGRSWMGLNHHCLLTMIAFCFLQHLRLLGKKNGKTTRRRLNLACLKFEGY